jgi:hypothetical protein
MTRQRDIPAHTLSNAIFFTEGDRIQQNLCRIGARTLERKIKLVTLLSEIVVIPPSHILESRITGQIISETPELLSKGIFAPSLPTKFDSFSEFLKDKRNEITFDFNYSSKRLDRLAELLDEYSRYRVRRDVDAMRQHLTESLLRDLNDTSSGLSRSLNLSESERQSLTEAIKTTFVSRDTLFILADRLSQRQRSVFLNHIQALYCLVGAKGNNSEPLVHPALIYVYRDKFTRLLGAYDPNLFYLVLEALGIRKDLLDSLSLREIIQLREESPVKKFRTKYHDLINEARTGKVVTSDSLTSLQTETLEEAVLSLLDKKLAEEYRKVSTHRKVKQIWSVASFSTTLISTILGILGSPLSPLSLGIATAAGLAGAINTFTGLTDPLIDHLFRTSGTEFILFATRMVEHEAEKLRSTSNGLTRAST